MMCFKDSECARIMLSRIEVPHMIRKGQVLNDGAVQTTAAHLYSLKG